VYLGRVLKELLDDSGDGQWASLETRVQVAERQDLPQPSPGLIFVLAALAELVMDAPDDGHPPACLGAEPGLRFSGHGSTSSPKGILKPSAGPKGHRASGARRRLPSGSVFDAIVSSLVCTARRKFMGGTGFEPVTSTV